MHREFIDLTAASYPEFRVSGVSGGCTWLWHPSREFSATVPVLTPVEISRKVNAGETVRAEIWRPKVTE